MNTIKTATIAIMVALCSASCCPKVSFDGCYLTQFRDFPDPTILPPERTNVPMYLSVTGSNVTGAWGKDGNFGELRGTVPADGKLLTGTWATVTAPVYSGSIWFTLATDGSSFTGTWNGTSASAPGGRVEKPLEWSGKRVGCATSPDFAILQKRVKK